MPAGANLKAYNSPWPLRNDTWSSLEESDIQLAAAESQHGPVEKLVEKVTELLDVLGPIERFWAFPGAQTYREVQRLFAADNYDRLAPLVTKPNRACPTESYLNGQGWNPGVEDDTYDHEARPAAQARTDRPYFEVLVVEDMTHEHERPRREELRPWAPP